MYNASGFDINYHGLTVPKLKLLRGRVAWAGIVFHVKEGFTFLGINPLLDHAMISLRSI